MGRRQFLGYAAAGAAGILLPTIVRPEAKVFDMGRGPRRMREASPEFRVYVSDPGGDYREITPVAVSRLPGGQVIVSIPGRATLHLPNRGSLLIQRRIESPLY
jgi:hypothetical protein